MKFERYLSYVLIFVMACVVSIGCDKMQKPVMDAMNGGMTDGNGDGMTDPEMDGDGDGMTDPEMEGDGDGMTDPEMDGDGDGMTDPEVDPDAIRDDDNVNRNYETVEALEEVYEKYGGSIFESYEAAVADAEIQSRLQATLNWVKENCGTNLDLENYDDRKAFEDQRTAMAFTHRNDREKFMDYLVDQLGDRDSWSIRQAVMVIDETNYFSFSYRPSEAALEESKLCASDN